ncbi:MAG: hypothetical protein V9H26_22170 [Verrucomicrobiota bacterium]
MLPALPKAQKILDNEWNKRMFAAKDKVFPTHIHPPVLAIIEGKTGDFQREDRQVKPLEMKLHRVTAQHSVADGKGMSLSVFDSKAKEVGEALGKQFFESVLQGVNEAVKETGNVVKFKKGGLEQEDVIRMLEMMDQNFDENGNPTGQMIGGSEFIAELKKSEVEWANDKEFQARIKEVRMRKRLEFHEREACRRLVG